ncbi:MAG TPA: amidohydrolase family protein [Spirillospora sp.]
MTRAIDVHVHPPTPEYLEGSGGPYFANAFGVRERAEPLSDLVRSFRAQGVEHAVLLAWDAQVRSGRPPTANAFVADAVRRFDPFFIGFGSVDPWKGQEALAELARFRSEYGFRGVKFHPPAQGFSPADPRFFPMWDLIVEQDLVVLAHAGHTGYGAGLPGGRGVRLTHARPFPDFEVLTTAFPRLRLICAHPGWPWHDDLLALAMHKSNVWIDLSGWSPKYLPPSVVQHARTLLKDKVLFGTDYPVITPSRWIGDLRDLGFSDAVLDKVLYRNAARLLGIE